MEQFLRMTDEELKGMIAFNAGDEVNDPFALSVLRFGPHRSIEDIDEVDDFAEIPLEDLTNVSDVDKIYDDDFIDHDNLET
jgi:hypothetical protein